MIVVKIDNEKPSKVCLRFAGDERRATSDERRATSDERRETSDEFSAGSALILTVVLTTLLAIIGVVFLLVARIDKTAATAASENREINFAIDSVLAKISQQLVLDVPGVQGQEYYDYPGTEDKWLASLEPYKSGNNYYWQQISDVIGNLAGQNRNVQAGVIADYDVVPGFADADGDGVGDSMWIILPGITSTKGKPIYAAIRNIDNGGMLNANTDYKFIPNADGSSQLQINLMALANRQGRPITPPGKDEVALLAERADYRFGNNPADLPKYETDLAAYEPAFIWRYVSPVGAYTPFDIGDELELRYRFLVNHEDIRNRIEQIWTWSFNSPTELNTPIRSGGNKNITDWFYRAQHDVIGPNDVYSYRHLATIFNIDRIIDPNGKKMVNVNTASAQQLYDVLEKFIAPDLAAQLALNIVDLRDNDVVVTTLPGRLQYGFEAQPFISEIAFKIDGNNPAASANNYFAIELYNPFEVPIPLGDFRLELRSSSDILKVNLAPYTIPVNGRFLITNNQEPNFVLAKYTQTSPPPNVNYTAERYDIYLLRKISGADIYLDRQVTQDAWFNWTAIKDVGQFYYRHDRDWNVVYQSLDPNSTGTLGMPNGGAGRTNYNIPTFAGGFVTVGDIARVLTVGPGPNPNDMIGVRLEAGPAEKDIRIDLANPAFVNIFQYLTVFDPAFYPWNDPNETKVKGRININTAPWFVIAQLPWITNLSLPIADPNRYALARAIAAYRDKLPLLDSSGNLVANYVNRTIATGSSSPLREGLSFASIGELMNVSVPPGGDPNYSICYYSLDGKDQPTFPDLTAPDGARDDFEEGDLIFSRISNLVTVRSDVFTAYILVRIGVDGPQKRVIAILDRSRVTPLTGKVKIIALQPVPDPR